jgi:hypothetical protein
MLPGLPAKLNYFVERAEDHLTPDNVHRSDRLIEAAINACLDPFADFVYLRKTARAFYGFQQCATYVLKRTTSERHPKPKYWTVDEPEE